MVGLIGLGIVGGPRLHGPTFAQGDFSVKVMRHIAKLKLWKSLERRIRGPSVTGFFLVGMMSVMKMFRQPTRAPIRGARRWERKCERLSARTLTASSEVFYRQIGVGARVIIH